jgi:hypothetical protein
VLARSLITAFESCSFRVVLDSAPVKLTLRVPVASEASANKPVPTETVDGFQMVARALEAPVPLIVSGAVTASESSLFARSSTRATAAVFQTNVPVCELESCRTVPWLSISFKALLFSSPVSPMLSTPFPATATIPDPTVTPENKEAVSRYWANDELSIEEVM